MLDLNQRHLAYRASALAAMLIILWRFVPNTAGRMRFACIKAEKGGFEPPERFRVRPLSGRVQLSTLPFLLMPVLPDRRRVTEFERGVQDSTPQLLNSSRPLTARTLSGPTNNRTTLY